MARIRSWLFAGIALGVVASILGMRWALIDRYGIDLPTWDEWDAQGLHALVPWFQHRPLLPELLTPHNEHVVALTKLANLALTLANGQWDQRLECVVNATLPAAIALGFLLWARSFLRSVFVVALVLVLIAAWGLPFAWHNAVSGFHSQQFFVIALSCTAIAWLPFSPPGSKRWWIAALASALALVSMASGFFAAVIVLILTLLRTARHESTFRAAWPTMLVSTACVVTGWLMRHDVPYHETLRAANVHDFLMTSLHALQWPVMENAWMAVILWLPWVLVAGFVLLGRPHNGAFEKVGWLMLGLGGWVWLNVAATAYGRGAGGPAPSTRYLDTLVIGSVVNALALGWLTQKFWPTAESESSTPAWTVGGRMASRAAVVLLAFAWISIFGGGVVRDSQRALRDDLPALRDYQRQALARTRAYLDTRNAAYLESKDIPYPGPDSFAYRVNLPELSRLLPTSAAPALTLLPRNDLHGFNRATDLRALPWNESAETGVLIGLSKPSHSPDAPFHRAFWASAGSDANASRGEWRPTKGPTAAGWLLFVVRSSAGAALEVRDEKSGELLSELRSNRANQWELMSTRLPSRAFVLRSRIAGPDPSLAFTEPVFMPTLSYLAWKISAFGRFVQAVGLSLISACTIGLGLAEWFAHRVQGRRAAGLLP